MGSHAERQEIVRHIGLKLGAGGILHRRRRARGLVTAHLDPTNAVDRFCETYESRTWVAGDGQMSLSGQGSEHVAARAIVDGLPSLLAGLGCRTLLDVGCGDWNWMREVRLPCAYIGIDIVPEVIEADRRYERAVSRPRSATRSTVRCRRRMSSSAARSCFTSRSATA